MNEIDDIDFDDEAYNLGNWSHDYLYDLDTSQYDFPNTLWHVKPTQEIAIKTTLMIIIAVPGIYLNGIIIFVLLKNKWLWSASNYLIGNLALVDFVTLVICPWFMLTRDFYQNYVLQQFGCKFEGFLQATLLLANVAAIILVSYDRLAAAALTSEARITKSAAPKFIVATWFASILLSLPWIIKREYMERQWKNYLEMYCVEDPKVLGVYWHFTLTLLVWIPMAIMVFTYGTIMWRLECSARDLTSRGGGQLVARAKSRTLRVTACVLIADVICRIPFSIMIYWNNNNSHINSASGSFEVLWFAANFLIYLNCAINPLIYGFTNLRFRKAMDRTSGVACCKFGSWCCICTSMRKKEVQLVEKNTEKIFIIDSTPRPTKKLSRLIKNILHINKDTMELSVPKVEEATTKPTKLTPLKENV